MAFKVHWVFFLVFNFCSWTFSQKPMPNLPPNMTIEKVWSLPPSEKLSGLRVGGFSGCVKRDDRVYFISDDRGGEGGARIISYSWDSVKNELDLQSGKTLKIENLNKKKILDLEGIAINSQGDFLLSNEGDLNKKPRQGPEIFWASAQVKRLRDVKIDSEFLPNPTGPQTQGIQNNLAFEGLSSDLVLKKWGAFLEGPLLVGSESVNTNKDANDKDTGKDNDKGSAAKNEAPALRDHLVYVESDIDSLKFDRKYKYPLPTVSGSFSLLVGVTDFLMYSENELLVLERGAEFSLQGLLLNAQLCQASKLDPDRLDRKCFYTLNNDVQLLKKISTATNGKTKAIPNFEGLCWLNDKKTQLIIVSDNNFNKTENTLFLFYNLH